MVYRIIMLHTDSCCLKIIDFLLSLHAALERCVVHFSVIALLTKTAAWLSCKDGENMSFRNSSKQSSQGELLRRFICHNHCMTWETTERRPSKSYVDRYLRRLWWRQLSWPTRLSDNFVAVLAGWRWSEKKKRLQTLPLYEFLQKIVFNSFHYRLSRMHKRRWDSIYFPFQRFPLWLSKVCSADDYNSLESDDFTSLPPSGPQSILALVATTLNSCCLWLKLRFFLNHDWISFTFKFVIHGLTGVVEEEGAACADCEDETKTQSQTKNGCHEKYPGIRPCHKMHRSWGDHRHGFQVPCWWFWWRRWWRRIIILTLTTLCSKIIDCAFSDSEWWSPNIKYLVVYSLFRVLTF